MRLLVSLVILCPLVALGDDEKPKPKVPVTGEASAKFAPFDQLMTEFIEKSGYPGAALAVAKDGQVVYQRGFGVADLETKAPLKPDALFRISSVTKPFTATAILQFVEQGKLRLDSRIMDVLELRSPARGFDERWRKVTIRHLLEHRGGWDTTVKDEDPMFLSPVIVKEVGGKHPATPAQIITYVIQKPMDFEPGTKYVYSNFGYCLLGRVIEKLSRQSYESHVKKHVQAPLGIKQMRLAKTLVRAPNEVRYYAKTKVPAVMGPNIGKTVFAPYGGFCIEAMDSHAGWLASAGDLVRFTQAFADPKTCKILKPATLEEMLARPTEVDAKANKWCAKGWHVQMLDDKLRVYYHDGAMDGVAAMVVHRPDGVTMALLLNCREKLNGKEPIEILNEPLHQIATQVFAKP